MLQVVHPAPVAEPSTNGLENIERNRPEEDCSTTTESWTDFTLPDRLSVTHRYLSRYYNSAIIHNTSGPAGTTTMSTTETEVYGNNIYPILFRIGNGGAGYTRILKILCLKFIWTHGNDFRIAWVANHSRHSQIALLGDVLQVALTYEPEVEKLAEREGWCRRVAAPAFWDHFVFVGPKGNPAGVVAGVSVSEALRAIADAGAVFHTRGDGSATFMKEQELWKVAGTETASATWLQTHTLPPYGALEKANEDGAYLLTDRSSFLTAKQDGVIPDLVVYVEGGKQLLNPCSSLINTKVPDSPAQRMAIRFAEWMGSEMAQVYFRGYGRVWEQGQPLFTAAGREEFGNEDTLAGRDL